MAAPGVSVTAHLPTIEHVSPQAVTFFPPLSNCFLSIPFLNLFLIYFISLHLSVTPFSTTRSFLRGLLSPRTLLQRPIHQLQIISFTTLKLVQLAFSRHGQRTERREWNFPEVCKKKGALATADDPSAGSFSVIMSKMAGTIGRFRDNHQLLKVSRDVDSVGNKCSRFLLCRLSGRLKRGPFFCRNESTFRRASETVFGSKVPSLFSFRRKWISSVECLFLR